MEQKKTKVLESLQKLKEQAEKNVTGNIRYVTMHSDCMLEFAKNAIDVLTQEEDKEETWYDRLLHFTEEKQRKLFDEGWFNRFAIGYAKIALSEMGQDRLFLSDFETKINRAFDFYDAGYAETVYKS